jgi:hypothetical protein
MSLLSFNEIQRELDEKFLPLEPMLTGFRILPQTADSPLGCWSEARGVALPGGLWEIASQFDLGKLTIGPVTFGTRGDYGEVLDLLNADQSMKDERTFIVFANSDPFSFAFATSNGFVYAIDPERGIPEGPIANSVAQFLRGVGTIFLRRPQAEDRRALADSIAAVVGAADQRFWRWLAS